MNTCVALQCMTCNYWHSSGQPESTLPLCTANIFTVLELGIKGFLLFYKQSILRFLGENETDLKVNVTHEVQLFLVIFFLHNNQQKQTCIALKKQVPIKLNYNEKLDVRT